MCSWFLGLGSSLLISQLYLGTQPLILPFPRRRLPFPNFPDALPGLRFCSVKDPSGVSCPFHAAALPLPQGHTTRVDLSLGFFQTFL